MGGINQDMVDAATNSDDLYHIRHDLAPTPFTYTLLTDGYTFTFLDDLNGQPVTTDALDFSNTDLYPRLSIGSMSLTELDTTGMTTWEDMKRRIEQGSLWYQWSTSGWKKNLVLTDAENNVVQFDAPLSLDYTYDVSDDINGLEGPGSAFQGQLFSLAYLGYYLGGLPTSTDKISPINLAAGTELSNSEGTFVLKPRFLVQHPKET
ncbi:hypothetical protein ACFL6N_08125, partial [Thermodesulfobacteriota bacterium]